MSGSAPRRVVAILRDRSIYQLVAYDLTHGDIVGFCDAGPARRHVPYAGELYAKVYRQGGREGRREGRCDGIDAKDDVKATAKPAVHAKAGSGAAAKAGTDMAKADEGAASKAGSSTAKIIDSSAPKVDAKVDA